DRFHCYSFLPCVSYPFLFFTVKRIFQFNQIFVFLIVVVFLWLLNIHQLFTGKFLFCITQCSVGLLMATMTIAFDDGVKIGIAVIYALHNLDFCAVLIENTYIQTERLKLFE